ncbi:hypothetical protein Pcinc_042153 [Petrolisthes cinctipes]|uniref:Uncharacterized protein n=1 Tax=Petrolisthes cinctipes TaxID=88211 RepID=A0AAE1BL69_PETCI|nr:hypothetical protein Pcinc_042153 [Petrolisthes cinctipes]
MLPSCLTPASQPANQPADPSTHLRPVYTFSVELNHRQTQKHNAELSQPRRQEMLLSRAQVHTFRRRGQH